MWLTDKGKAESIWDRVAHTKQELFTNNLESEDPNESCDILEKKCLNYISKGIPVYKLKHKQRCAAKITGDIACDSYHKVDEDVNLLKELGVSIYWVFYSNNYENNPILCIKKKQIIDFNNTIIVIKSKHVHEYQSF